MTIFSRRVIQQMLNENADFMTEQQLKEHVSRLNKKNFQALETEWEVAVINAFSKLGSLQHEPDLGGTGKLLDILFIPHQDANAQLVVDVATVSDEGFEKETPVKAFYVEFDKRIKKAGLIGNGFEVRVGSQQPARWGERSKPMIPPRGEFDKEIFNPNFKAFLNRIHESPDQTHRHRISTAKTSILITYTPNRRFSSSTFPVYNQPTSKRQNTVYNALKLKAQEQFKKISYTGPKGIVLCDGGSDMLHSQPNSSFDVGFNVSDVIKEFLQKNQSIDFVLILTSVFTNESMYQLQSGGRARKIQVRLIPNKSFANLPQALKGSLAELEQHFPDPINTADGARDTIRYGFDPKPFLPLAGGIGYSHKQIEINASAVLGLLAGVVTQEELFEALGFKPWSTDTHAFRNLFESMLSQKMRIVEIQVEETNDDDSRLIFKFDGPDPALSPFINPKTKKKV